MYLVNVTDVVQFNYIAHNNGPLQIWTLDWTGLDRGLDSQLFFL